MKRLLALALVLIAGTAAAQPRPPIQYVQINNTTTSPGRPTINFVGAGVSVADDATNKRTTVTFTGGGGGGGLSSIGLALPGIFNVSGSPLVANGTITATLATQAANLFWAGPTTGAAAAPGFRGIVAVDIPPLAASILTSGQVLPIRGGTGLDTSALTGVPYVSGGTWSVAAIGGDGSGTPAAFSVVKLRGIALDPAIASAGAGQDLFAVCFVNAGPSFQLCPSNIDPPSVGGHFLVDNGAGLYKNVAASGDFTLSTAGLMTAIALRGHTVVAGTPTDGQLLIGKTSDGSWNPATIIPGANITVTNGPGTITIASSGGAGGYATVDAAGTPLTPRSVLNFGAEFTAVDNSGATRTDISMASLAISKLTGGPLGASLGGLGVASPTAHAVLVGEGASAVTPIAVGGANTLLAGAASADPAFTATPSVTTLTGNTSLLTPLLDAASAGALNLGTTTATSIALKQNTTLPTGKTLVVGSNTLIGSITDKLNLVHLAVASQAVGDFPVADSPTTYARVPACPEGFSLIGHGTSGPPTCSKTFQLRSTVSSGTVVATTTDVTVTLPGSGTNAVTLSGTVCEITTAITGTNTPLVTFTAGASGGTAEFLASQSIGTGGTVGTVYGIATTSYGSGYTAANGYSDVVAGGSTLVYRTVTSAGPSTFSAGLVMACTTYGTINN